jgi:sugar lactone lactonase YvrE
MKLRPLIFIGVCFFSIIATAQTVSTVSFCSNKASFNSPMGVLVDEKDQVFVVDQANHSLRLLQTNGFVGAVAGNGSPGSANSTILNCLGAPYNATKDKDGNIYITTQYASPGIRKIDKDGVISTFASSGMGTFTDGTGSSSWFTRPAGIVYDSVNKFIYVADNWGHSIHRISMTGEVKTLAGSGLRGFADGTGANAKFSYPEGIAVDSKGNLYVADSDNHRIRKVTPEGVVSTFAGSTQGFANGTTSASLFNNPTGLAFDKNEVLYLTDRGNYRVRKISEGIVSTYSGSGEFGYKDTIASHTKFGHLYGIAIDAIGNVLVADAFNHAIRMVTPYNYNESLTLAGTGKPGYVDGCQALSLLSQPMDIVMDNIYSGIYYYTDFMDNRIMRVDAYNNLTVYAGRKLRGNKDGKGEEALLDGPLSLAIDKNGILYFTEQGSHSIKKISRDREVTTIAGNGVAGYKDGNALEAQFSFPTGIAVDASGVIWLTDGNSRIRKIEAGVVSTFAGTVGPGYMNGPLAGAKFSLIQDMVAEKNGSLTVISNNSVRRIKDNVVITMAGNGTSGYVDGDVTDARFDLMVGITGDGNGNYFIADSRNNVIRWMDANNVVSTVGGNGNKGYVDGESEESEFDFPTGIAIHTLGDYLLVADQANKAIRKIEGTFITTALKDELNSSEVFVTISPVPNTGSFSISNTIKVEKVTITNLLGQHETYYSNDITTSLKGLLVLHIYTANDMIVKKVFVK